MFAGGCTLQAAKAVCGGEGIDTDAVFDLLASLVARSLVVAEERGLETRYRLLETIRQYGEQRLDAGGGTERWRARHAAAIIQGAAGAYVAASAGAAQLISSILTATLGEERARGLRARGAGMGWDQALAYTLTQATQALGDLQPETQP